MTDTYAKSTFGPGEVVVTGRQDGRPFAVLIQPARSRASWSTRHLPASPTGGGGVGSDCANKSVVRLLRRLAAGVPGLARAELAKYGVGAASDTVALARKKTCEACPSGKYDFGVCTECGCYLAAKITIAGEACPLGHWES